jgi:hypothetical protein
MLGHFVTQQKENGLLIRLFLLSLSIGLLFVFHTGQANEGNWLKLESEGLTIFKRYGLPEGKWVTMTFYPPIQTEPEHALQRFYKLIDEDLPRAGNVLYHYQTEIAERSGLSVIISLKRFRDRAGRRSLVYYQGFYRPGPNRMWFVRTDLNDNLLSLSTHYDEMLDIILRWIGIKKN